MNFFVIGDDDTVLGFRYAGVPGKAVSTPQEAAQFLKEIAGTEDELIIIITEQIANSIRRQVNAIRFGAALPLIVEIPGPGGPSEQTPELMQAIRQAVGIRI